MARAAYETRSEREERQQAAYLAALQAPDVPAALFAQWPNKLPRRIRPLLSRQHPSVLRAWKALRSAQAQREDEALVNRVIGHLKSQTNFEASRSPHLAFHEAAIADLWAKLRRLSGPKELTVSWIPLMRGEEGFVGNPEESRMATFRMNGEGQVEADPEVLCKALIGEAMTGNGSLIVRQTLALRVQHVQPDGSMAWVAQQNVYGWMLMGSKATAVDPASLKESFSVNHETGERLMLEPGVYYKMIKD